MSRGHWKWECAILAKLERQEEFDLIDLLPPGYTRSQLVAIERAARNLEDAGKIERDHDGGKVVILKPTNYSESWAPTWEEREEEADQEWEEQREEGADPEAEAAQEEEAYQTWLEEEVDRELYEELEDKGYFESEWPDQYEE
jgi:hypothetical protein